MDFFKDTENIVGVTNELGASDESTFYPTISLGYSKQTTKGFMYRTGAGIAVWVFVGSG